MTLDTTATYVNTPAQKVFMVTAASVSVTAEVTLLATLEQATVSAPLVTTDTAVSRRASKAALGWPAASRVTARGTHRVTLSVAGVCVLQGRRGHAATHIVPRTGTGHTVQRHVSV